MPWRRERLPMPVFWPGELYSPWGRKELAKTEQLSLLQLEKANRQKGPGDSEETLRGEVGNCRGLVFHFLCNLGEGLPALGPISSLIEQSGGLPGPPRWLSMGRSQHLSEPVSWASADCLISPSPQSLISPPHTVRSSHRQTWDSQASSLCSHPLRSMGTLGPAQVGVGSRGCLQVRKRDEQHLHLGTRAVGAAGPSGQGWEPQVEGLCSHLGQQSLVPHRAVQTAAPRRSVRVSFGSDPSCPWTNAAQPQPRASGELCP